jgi:hypothetical protein
MLAFLKHLMKKYFLILKVRNRLSPTVQLAQKELYHRYREMARNNSLPHFSETGFRVFSQFEEDGVLLYIFSLLGMPNKTFIEIGADDGVNSNSANLYFHHSWHGLFIDGNPRSLERGRYFFSRYPHNWYYPPMFKQAYVTRENVNQLIEEAGFSGEIGLLSIDIDGNDYWVWDALEVVQPQVVIIETHNEFGTRNIVVPYDSNYVYPGKHPLYHGASPLAMQLLGKKKGYRLVGSNQLASNFVFVRNGLLENEIPEANSLDLLNHPSTLEGMKGFKEIEHYHYLTPIEVT